MHAHRRGFWKIWAVALMGLAAVLLCPLQEREEPLARRAEHKPQVFMEFGERLVTLKLEKADAHFWYYCEQGSPGHRWAFCPKGEQRRAVRRLVHSR